MNDWQGAYMNGPSLAFVLDLTYVSSRSIAYVLSFNG